MPPAALAMSGDGTLYTGDAYDNGASAFGDSRALLLPPGLGWNAFTFRLREGQIDWRAVGRVDVERVTAEVDVRTLQGLLPNMTMSAVRIGDLRYVPDDLQVKLVHLQQLAIEYLLNLQSALYDHAAGISARLTKGRRAASRMRQGLEVAKVDKSKLRRELRAQQRALQTYKLAVQLRGDLPPGAATSAPCAVAHVCQHCSKAFGSHWFLAKHMHRRHPGMEAAPIPGIAEAVEDALAEARTKWQAETTAAVSREQVACAEVQSKLTVAIAARDAAVTRAEEAVAALKDMERRASDAPGAEEMEAAVSAAVSQALAESQTAARVAAREAIAQVEDRAERIRAKLVSQIEAERQGWRRVAARTTEAVRQTHLHRMDRLWRAWRLRRGLAQWQRATTEAVGWERCRRREGAREIVHWDQRLVSRDLARRFHAWHLAAQTAAREELEVALGAARRDLAESRATEARAVALAADLRRTSEEHERAVIEAGKRIAEYEAMMTRVRLENAVREATSLVGPAKASAEGKEATMLNEEELAALIQRYEVALAAGAITQDELRIMASIGARIGAKVDAQWKSGVDVPDELKPKPAEIRPLRGHPWVEMNFPVPIEQLQEQIIVATPQELARSMEAAYRVPGDSTGLEREQLERLVEQQRDLQLKAPLHTRRMIHHVGVHAKDVVEEHYTRDARQLIRLRSQLAAAADLSARDLGVTEADEALLQRKDRGGRGLSGGPPGSLEFPPVKAGVKPPPPASARRNLSVDVKSPSPSPRQGLIKDLAMKAAGAVERKAFEGTAKPGSSSARGAQQGEAEYKGFDPDDEELPAYVETPMRAAQRSLLRPSIDADNDRRLARRGRSLSSMSDALDDDDDKAAPVPADTPSQAAHRRKMEPQLEAAARRRAARRRRASSTESVSSSSSSWSPPERQRPPPPGSAAMGMVPMPDGSVEIPLAFTLRLDVAGGGAPALRASWPLQQQQQQQRRRMAEDSVLGRQMGLHHAEASAQRRRAEASQAALWTSSGMGATNVPPQVAAQQAQMQQRARQDMAFRRGQQSTSAPARSDGSSSSSSPAAMSLLTPEEREAEMRANKVAVVQKHGAKYRQAWDLFDADGDGELTLEEVAGVCTEMGVNVADAKQMIADADTDRSGTLDFAEFCVMMEAGSGMLKDLAQRRLIRRLTKLLKAQTTLIKNTKKAATAAASAKARGGGGGDVSAATQADVDVDVDGPTLVSTGGDREAKGRGVHFTTPKSRGRIARFESHDSTEPPATPPMPDERAPEFEKEEVDRGQGLGQGLGRSGVRLERGLSDASVISSVPPSTPPPPESEVKSKSRSREGSVHVRDRSDIPPSTPGPPDEDYEEEEEEEEEENDGLERKASDVNSDESARRAALRRQAAKAAATLSLAKSEGAGEGEEKREAQAQDMSTMEMDIQDISIGASDLDVSEASTPRASEMRGTRQIRSTPRRTRREDEDEEEDAGNAARHERTPARSTRGGGSSVKAFSPLSDESPSPVRRRQRASYDEQRSVQSVDEDEDEDEDDVGRGGREGGSVDMLNVSSDWDEGSTVLSSQSSPRSMASNNNNSSSRASLGSVTQVTDMRSGGGASGGAAGGEGDDLLVEDL